jgi:hypothetical protein
MPREKYNVGFDLDQTSLPGNVALLLTGMTDAERR